MQRQRPGENRWSAAEVLEHLTLVESAFGGRILKALEAARVNLSPEAQPRAPLPYGLSAGVVICMKLTWPIFMPG